MSSEPKSRVVYENLDTTFVNLWALLRKLSQRGFNGRVHVELKDYTADVFMTGTSTPLVHEIDRAAGTETTEEAALHRLVLRVRETPGTISVFEEAAENRLPDQSGLLLNATDLSDVPLTKPPAVAAQAPPPALTDDDDDDEITQTSRSSVPDLVGPSLPSADPAGGIEWAAILKTSGELVGGVERALNGAGADFSSLFNRARLDLADDYTFLDPISGQFTYANSVVTLNAEVPGAAYVAGLSETLRRAVDAIATGDRARRVRERVALELLSVARKRREILERSGFQSQLDRIAGTKVL